MYLRSIIHLAHPIVKLIVGLQLNVRTVHRLAQPLKIHSLPTAQVQECSHPLGTGLQGYLIALTAEPIHTSAHSGLGARAAESGLKTSPCKPRINHSGITNTIQPLSLSMCGHRCCLVQRAYTMPTAS